MNTMYKIFMSEVITELEIRYKDCEYSSMEELKKDIYFDSEEILQSCTKESVTDVAEDGVGELACGYLKEMGATMEMLFKVISDPEKILYCAYCTVFNEAVDSFVENFDYIEDEG